jgi:tetratricopeptide (TPR) repeat protein
MELNHSDPDYIDAMRIYLSGQWKEADEAFKKLAQKYDQSTFVRLLQGNIYYSLGKLDEAVDFYNKAIEINPEFGIAYYKLGVCYYRMGKLQRALDSYSKVIDLKNQSHAMASYFVGLINLFLGKDDAAAEGFAQFREMSAESLIANFYLAQLKIKRKEYTDALDLLNELVKQTPDFAEVHYMMGVAHYGVHNNTDAIKCFRRALQLNPDDQRSKSKLALLTDVQWP